MDFYNSDPFLLTLFVFVLLVPFSFFLYFWYPRQVSSTVFLVGKLQLRNYLSMDLCPFRISITSNFYNFVEAVIWQGDIRILLHISAEG